MEVIYRQYVKNLLPPRAGDAHKGSFGRTMIVAGSPGMAGAAALCARAAFRGGAGLVTVSIDEALFPVIHGGVAEATCIGRKIPADRLKTFDAVAIGPGLGQSKDALGILGFIAGNYDGKLALDADALNLMAAEGLDGSDNEKKCRAELIITPHEGEAARLLGMDVSGIKTDRRGAAEELASKYGATAVLKGSETLVATGRSIWVNHTGNPGMATAGSGDVLTGLITALAGQGLSAANAAIAAVYLHGLAGDLAAREKGEYSMIAGDIIEKLPDAFQMTLSYGLRG